MSFNRDLFSIMVPDFILLFPSETSLLEDHHHHQQQQQLTFKAYISAPSEFQLIGWHESMVGQTQDKAQGDTLQLLARSQGRFLAIEILHLGDRDESGGQSVLACVSLPLDMAAFKCCQLRLELMRDDALLCNYNTMLVRSDLYPEVQDVKGWAKPPRTPAQISAFIEDLAEYLSFQSLLHHAGKHAPALLDSVGMTPGRNAGRASNWDSLLPVLLAEACRPEMLQMMAEVGMDLLQHAVSWGMVHLAERILSGMLAPPLNIPFATIASGTLSADCDTACPPARQSLLSYALMSEDVVMFERVLGWGHLYGGPTFMWELDGSGVGSDPQLARMVQALPTPHDHLAHSHAAALHQLLGVGAPAAAAEVQRAWGAKHGDAGALQLPLRQRQLSGGQTVGSPSSACAAAAATATPSSAAASATPPNSVVAPSGMVSSSSSSATPSSGPSRTPSFAQGLLPPSVSHGNALVSVARALAMGFGEHGDIKESQYRAWCKACCVGLANKVCIGVVPFFWLQAALSLSRGLYKSAFTLALYPVPMFLALITKNCKKREACMFWAKIFHLCYYIIFGLGLMPTIVARKLAITHLDFIVEVILCRLLWQVQLRALLVERAASTIGSSMLYSRLQFQHPLLQALAINFASVCVGIALDVRNRRMYVHLVRARALLSQRGQKVQ
ncbi:hypothetical protein DUNSADRAFT_13034 [Dunaliella salina]|uniref:Anaphase-promoting complex subunit 1 n=1 Tax=Dunaliella salina TaxID=3046 RepID=A0ABQ7GA94_DUNSA|nr:hypothetical protein DUNSADRAFT_13034 [Dunaliella salina]|eukprot:KAF5831503.1 hypothetical protein DUNSADRAFT_13034 [Dunaliella salina]